MMSLESYAAVLAGLGAGLPFRLALVHAEIELPQWERAAKHWQAQIDESAASDLTLLVSFDAALLAAQRRFEPTVEPIESDVHAWAQFRRHFVTAVDPLAFLEQRGVSPATYARLEADWANRVLGDEALAATLQKHLQAPLEACPTLTLIPSPLLIPKDTAQAAKPPAPPREARLDDRAMEAPRAITPLVPLGMPAVSPSVAFPDVPLDPQPPPAPLRSTELSPWLPPGMRAFADVAGTQLAPEAPPTAPVLPFDPSATPVLPEPSEAPSRMPASMRGITDVGETHVISAAPSAPMLPFDPPASEAARDPEAPASRLPPGMRRFADVHGTPLAPEAAPRGPPQPPKPEEAPSWMPAGMRKFANVEGTQILSDVPASSSLPFTPPSPSLKTLPSPDDDVSEAPRLSLEQHACLCAELALDPANRSTILRHYGLDDVQRQQLDAFWGTRMQIDDNLREAWEEFCTAHRTRLLQTVRRKR